MQCGKSNNPLSMMVLAWLSNRLSSLVFVPCLSSFCQNFKRLLFSNENTTVLFRRLPRYICVQFMRFFWKATPDSEERSSIV